MSCLYAFSRAWHRLHVFASNSDWSTVLFTSVIGQSIYFGYGFSTLNCKLVYFLFHLEEYESCFWCLKAHLPFAAASVLFSESNLHHVFFFPKNIMTSKVLCSVAENHLRLKLLKFNHQSYCYYLKASFTTNFTLGLNFGSLFPS